MHLVGCCIALIIVGAWQHIKAQVLGFANVCQGEEYGDAGDFDLYILQQTWPAKFCDDEPQSVSCQQPTPFMRVNVTIHGLWPSYFSSRNGNKWPQCCRTRHGVSMSPTVFQPLSPRLQQLWPDFKRPHATSPRNSIWDYEWGKHGTCADTTQLDYFHTALDMAEELGTPPSVVSRGRSGNGGAVRKSDVESHYGSPCVGNQACMVVLECDNGALSSVNTCWNMNHQSIMCPAPIVQSKSRRKCPPSILVLSF